MLQVHTTILTLEVEEDNISVTTASEALQKNFVFREIVASNATNRKVYNIKPISDLREHFSDLIHLVDHLVYDLSCGDFRRGSDQSFDST